MTAPLKILLLEDNPADAALIERELRRGGFEPTLRRVDSREAFTDALRTFAPDLILSDNTLPGFDGLTALAIARSALPETPFIFVSGTIGEERAIESIKSGATDYVLKDRLARLPAVIRRAVQETEERSARRHAEEALRESEHRHRSFVEAARDVIFTLSAEGTTASLNPAFETITGWPRDRWLGRPFHELLHPEDVSEAGRILKQCLQGKAPAFFALRVRAHSGSYRTWEFTLTPQRAEDRTLGILGIARDITDRLSLETQFHQAQKMEVVGRLAGGVAHDFNNMLTVINGYSQLLLMRLSPGDPQREPIEEIRKAGERAAGLTRQLLAFSRNQVLQPTVFDLNAVVADMDKMLRRLIGEDIEVVTALDPTLGRVKADAGQIGQVIMNLAVNARDAMPHGGKLIVETANRDLDESYTRQVPDTRPGPYVMISISDTGSGMDAETKARLFEPFFTTKEKGRGTGLGLSTVYGIVKQSGGHIGVYSEPGRGTSFKIYLPRVTEAAEPRKPDTTRTRRLRGAETILLVEDDDAVRALVLDILQKHGYTVLAARDGRESLLKIETHKGPIHLLLTDLVMPGVGGGDLLDLLAPAHPNMKVVYMSGYTDRAAAHQGLPAPGDAFLQKPFTPEELARKVREVLG